LAASAAGAVIVAVHIQTLRMAFTADGKVAVMEHHASAGWPTAIMAQGFMAKGLHGCPMIPSRSQAQTIGIV